MPLTVRCKECGCVLYDGDFLAVMGEKYRWRVSFTKVAEMHEGICPNCGRTLDPSKSKVIRVTAADES